MMVLTKGIKTSHKATLKPSPTSGMVQNFEVASGAEDSRIRLCLNTIK